MNSATTECNSYIFNAKVIKQLSIDAEIEHPSVPPLVTVQTKLLRNRLLNLVAVVDLKVAQEIIDCSDDIQRIYEQLEEALDERELMQEQQQ